MANGKPSWEPDVALTASRWRSTSGAFHDDGVLASGGQKATAWTRKDGGSLSHSHRSRGEGSRGWKIISAKLTLRGDALGLKEGPEYETLPHSTVAPIPVRPSLSRSREGALHPLTAKKSVSVWLKARVGWASYWVYQWGEEMWILRFKLSWKSN